MVGIPFDSAGKRYNSVGVYSPAGQLVTRQLKINLVGGDSWAVGGRELSVFPVDGVPSSVVICHDSRYPELIRLPVLAGAKLIFYVSNESTVTQEHKLDPYRAQISARADENDVYIVHSNGTAPKSHGQSRTWARACRVQTQRSNSQCQTIWPGATCKSYITLPP